MSIGNTWNVIPFGMAAIVIGTAGATESCANYLVYSVVPISEYTSTSNVSVLVQVEIKPNSTNINPKSLRFSETKSQIRLSMLI